MFIKYVIGNSNEQVITLCAISAAGSVVPHIHIFQVSMLIQWRVCAKCVFWKSDKGWINTQLFYKWLRKQMHRNNLTISAINQWPFIDTSKLHMQGQQHFALLASSTYITHHTSIRCELLWSFKNSMEEGSG